MNNTRPIWEWLMLIMMVICITIGTYIIISMEPTPGVKHITVTKDSALHIAGDSGVVINCIHGTLVVNQDTQQPLVLLCETSNDIEYVQHGWQHERNPHIPSNPQTLATILQ